MSTIAKNPTSHMYEDDENGSSIFIVSVERIGNIL